MGKKDKDKDKEKKRQHSDSNSDSGSSSDERHKKKHKEKHKDKDKKKKKHRKDKRDKVDMVQAAKDFLKQTLAGRQPGDAPAAAAAGAQQGPTAAGPGPGSLSQAAVRSLAPTLEASKRISQADYNSKNIEFTAWLLEDRKLYFNDLTSDQTRELFQEDFIAVWNAGQLGPAYYAGTMTRPTRLTTHAWKFKGADEDRAAGRQDQKQWKAEQKERLDEMLPKATGREAVIEKRIARREDAKARDASPDTVRLPGGGDMFGGDDSFAAAKAWEAKRADQMRGRKNVRADLMQQRVDAFQAQEDAKMAQFRALAAQGPIVIPKRQ